jgi:2-polyprenyl-3-methyl-5-hydroxy-6-metoxy-1,4-benzoquinol methylase
MIVRSQPEREPAQSGCELCGATSVRELYTARDRLRNSDQLFSIVACEGCGVWRTLPEMSERELAQFYPDQYWGETDEPSEQWIRASQSEKLMFLRKCGLVGGRILDVGCGAGFFLRALDSNCWERFGVEIAGQASAIASKRLGRDHIFNCTLIEAPFASSSFDVITFWSTLEHMNRPRAAIIKARQIIKRGGSVIIQVPNAASYQARFFKGCWFALDAPRHRYHFRPDQLKQLLSDAGFEVYRTTLFSRAHNAHALRQSLKARLGGDKTSLRFVLFLLLVPLIRPFDWLMSAAGSGATITIAARAM